MAHPCWLILYQLVGFAEGEDETGAAWEQQILNRIMQQIKGIAKVPGPEQAGLLRGLAEEAATAAKRCNPETAKQLLKLADFARSREASKQTGHLPFGSLYLVLTSH